MAKEYYIRAADKILGPLSVGQLKQLAGKGKIKPDTPVRIGKEGEWVKAGRLKGLFPKIESSIIEKSTSNPITTTKASYNEIEANSLSDSQSEPEEYSSAVEHKPPTWIKTSQVSETKKEPLTIHLDKETITLAVGVIALFVLTLSPLLPWAKMGIIELTGIKGDGKYLMALSVAGLGLIIISYLREQFKYPSIFINAVWGIICLLWQGWLIYTVESSARSTMRKLQDNPFGQIISMNSGAGSGLYIGLLSAMVVAGTFCYLLYIKSSDRQTYFSSKIVDVLGRRFREETEKSKKTKISLKRKIILFVMILLIAVSGYVVKSQMDERNAVAERRAEEAKKAKELLDRIRAKNVGIDKKLEQIRRMVDAIERMRRGEFDYDPSKSDYENQLNREIRESLEKYR